MDRFHIAPGEWSGERLVLRGDEAHHCLRVMRKEVGEQVMAFDGAGRWAVAELTETGGGEVVLRVVEAGREEALRPELVLLVAIPKGKTMDLIVQKAVELGVAVIQPLVTERTVVRLEEKGAGKKREKWQRVALEACKQCGQNTLPAVREPMGLAACLAEEGGGVKLMASLAEGARSFREMVGGMEECPERVAILVGPEGDFTPGETAAALAAGFQAVTLGRIVLRVETAALYSLSALRFWWEDDTTFK